MIKSKTATTKWNARTKKHYESLGYTYTKMGDEFELLVEHLPENSYADISVACDYCGECFTSNLNERNKKFRQNPTVKKDTCSKKECINEKIKESNLIQYGTEYAISSTIVREKINSTLNEKYGVENPFQLDEVKNKIKETNIEKYGNESYVRTEEYKNKTEKTNLERYGVKNPMQSKSISIKLKGRFVGDKHYNWKGGVSKRNTLLRQTSGYRKWRTEVYNRDSYTCQCCGDKGGILNAHHIENFSDNDDLRLDINNGITLCIECHNAFHKEYGRKNNNANQLNEFIINHGKNVC